MLLMERLFIFSLIMLAIIGNSCSATSSMPNSTSYVSNDILFKLSTSKTHYKVGEDVLISTYVKNQTSEDFRYRIPSLGPHLTMSIFTSDESGHASYTEEGGWNSGGMRLDAVGGGKIEAEGRISLDATWNQMLSFYIGDFQSELRLVEPGQYTIVSTFYASSFGPLSLDIWIDD